jgi:hypothetical protein
VNLSAPELKQQCLLAERSVPKKNLKPVCLYIFVKISGLLKVKNLLKLDEICQHRNAIVIKLITIRPHEEIRTFMPLCLFDKCHLSHLPQS